MLQEPSKPDRLRIPAVVTAQQEKNSRLLTFPSVAPAFFR